MIGKDGRLFSGPRLRKFDPYKTEYSFCGYTAGCSCFRAFPLVFSAIILIVGFAVNRFE